jgi:hypothetical protein
MSDPLDTICKGLRVAIGLLEQEQRLERDQGERCARVDALEVHARNVQALGYAVEVLREQEACFRGRVEVPEELAGLTLEAR